MGTLTSHTARAVGSLADAVHGLVAQRPAAASLRASSERGHFRPEEDIALKDWFARFLTVRGNLWEVLGEVSQPLGGDPRRVQSRDDWRLFVIGYVAACLVVRLDRLLVEEVATHSVTQRKLNEGSARYRIPRKQFTASFKSLSNPMNAKAMYQAMRFAAAHRGELQTLAAGSLVGALVAGLPRLEAYLDPSKRGYLQRWAGYRDHSVRRRGASGRQQTTHAVLEVLGNVAARLRDRWAEKNVTAEVRNRLAELLAPGDVLVTRHERAFTNLVLPGYWPHAALYVGTEADRQKMGIFVEASRAGRWSGSKCVLEALKDGVLFRDLAETLAVDAVAILRPALAPTEIARCIGRAVDHEGKLYNFDFDFFRADRLVCTEVVYRAYDGAGPIRLELKERAGHPTLSAEDLLDVALDCGYFEPLALFGAPSCSTTLVQGQAAREALTASYRDP